MNAVVAEIHAKPPQERQYCAGCTLLLNAPGQARAGSPSPEAGSVPFTPSDVDAYIAATAYTESGIECGAPKHDREDIMSFYEWLRNKPNAPDGEGNLVGRLRELQRQWQETAKVLRPVDQDGAVAHLECADELGQILDGNLDPIAKWTDAPNNSMRVSE